MTNETQSLKQLNNLIRLFDKLQSTDSEYVELSSLYTKLHREIESKNISGNTKSTTKHLFETLLKLEKSGSANRSVISRAQRGLKIVEQPFHDRLDAEKTAATSHSIEEIIENNLRHILNQTEIRAGTVAVLGLNHIATFVKILPDFRISILGEENTESNYEVIHENISECPRIPDQSFDLVLSANSFEMIDRPWLASSEIKRILKNNGATFHLTTFSNYYNPNPIDYWRFSPTCMQTLFDGLESLVAEFYSGKRRKNGVAGQGEVEKSFEDGFGGWRETWYTLYAGIKR